MASVTQRTHQIKQPYGGYLPVRYFYKTKYTDEYTLHEEENIHSSLVGLAVDYLSRYMSGDAAENAFEVSLRGASIINEIENAYTLLNEVSGLDSRSIICACKLSGYDVCYRAGPQSYTPVEDIEPDEMTIHNIRVMVVRCMNLFQIIGPITKTNIQFDGGYTRTVNKGDGDYMTENAIWDLKVSKSTPTSKHTLQLLMYYIMGLHSDYPEFHNIKHLGLFNPRLNLAYTIDVNSISVNVIQAVESDVICYGNEEFEQEEPNTYTVAEVSEILGIKKKMILGMIRNKSIRATKVKNRYELDEKAVRKLIKCIRKQRILYVVRVIFLIAFLFMITISILRITAR